MSEIPSGTITFLFIEIEGSTVLWERYPKAIREALARYNALLKEGVETRHGGYVFKTVGDAVYAAFSSAVEALRAALETQQRLAEQDWSAVGGLAARMALHTGEAEAQDDPPDYIGASLSRVARLLSIARGGQVLLSQATCDLVRDHLPADAEMRNLGKPPLKDLAPEPIFQLLHPSLSSDPPAIRLLESIPNNLPLPLTSFIGREVQIAQVKQLLKETRLLTLTGSGGCGKSRLALQVAADILDAFAEGIWLVDLAERRQPELVEQAAAAAFGMREEPGRTLTAALLDYLRDKTLLLLLDNCEHLRIACAQLAEAILETCPKVRFLITSREAMGLTSEVVWLVPSLSHPDTGLLSDTERLSGYEAVRLFVARAGFHQPGFTLTPANAAAVAQICTRLEGIPFAIELAAARLNMLTVEQIAAFNDYIRLLKSGSRTAPTRQQTLLATIEWSYDLLEEREKALLRHLCVFAGGWTPEAAEKVCTDEGIDAPDVSGLLSQLVGASLVLAEEPEDTPRFRMLETVRQYASNRLEALGETEATRDRHLAYFLTLAEQAEPELTGPDQVAWLDRLEREHDNLRAALTRASEAETRLRLAGALWRFWYVRGHIGEGRVWLENALAGSSGASDLVRAKALNGAGALAMIQTDYTAARKRFEESLTLRRQSGDIRGMADTLNNLGTLTRSLGDLEAARAYYAESLTLRKQTGDRQRIAGSLSNLGMIARDQSDFILAQSYHAESLEIRRALNDTAGVATALLNMGVVNSDQGEYTIARSYFEQSLDLLRMSGNKWLKAVLLYNLGEVAFKQGDMISARQLLEESLTLGQELGDRENIARVLVSIAVMAADQSDYQRTARLLGIEEGLRASTGARLEPTISTDYDRSVAVARSALGQEAFAEAWAEGKAMAIEQAILYALGRTDA